MTPLADAELLARYAADRSETAFSELVRRHVNLVYSAALRQVRGDVHLAQDVTQTVFSDLARKAGALKTHAALTAWLYTSTRYAALQLLRTERRRELREQEAHRMQILHSASDPAGSWDGVQPVIDDAMHDLSEPQRRAVLLRFFEGQSYPEVGAHLGISEEAARKRVDRALEELRAGLTRRGIASTATALGLLLGERAVFAAPAGLAPAVTATAVAGGGAAVAAFSLRQFFFSTTLLGGVAATLAISVAIFGWSQHRAQAELRAQIALQRSENTRLAATRTATLHTLSSELAAARAAAAAQSTVTADPAAAPDPEARRRQRLGFRAMFDRSRSPLFRRLALPPAELEAFIELMLDREEAEGASRRAAHAQGLKLETHADVDLLHRAATVEIRDRMRALLGAEKYAYYENYEHTLPFRHLIARLTQTSAGTANALSDEQVDRIVNQIAAAFPDMDSAFDGMGYAIPDHALERLKPELTPAQFTALCELQAAQRAQREMAELNRAAAAKGLLRLTGQSLHDFPPPAGSPASETPNLAHAPGPAPDAASLVTVAFKQEPVERALSLYAQLTGKKVEVAPSLSEPHGPSLSLKFQDLPPAAAAALLKNALIHAGVVFSPVDAERERATPSGQPSTP